MNCRSNWLYASNQAFPADRKQLRPLKSDVGPKNYYRKICVRNGLEDMTPSILLFV